MMPKVIENPILSANNPNNGNMQIIKTLKHMLSKDNIVALYSDGILEFI